MFNFFHSILGKIAVGVSSLFIGVAGFISPVPKTALAPLATSTSEIRTTGTTTVKLSDYAQQALKNNSSNSGKTTPTPVKNIQSFSEWKATQPTTTKTQTFNFAPPVPAPVVQPNPASSEKPATNTNDNFSSGAASAVLSEAKFYQDLNDLAVKMIDYFDSNTDQLNTLIARQEGIKAALNGNAPISDSFIASYNEDISNIAGFKNTLVADQNYAKVQINQLKDKAIQLSSRYVSLEEWKSVLQSFQTDPNWDAVNNNISQTWNNYIAYRKKRDNEYEKVNAMISAMATKVNESPSEVIYQPQPVPQFQMPQLPRTTNCTIMPGPSGGFAYSTVQCN